MVKRRFLLSRELLLAATLGIGFGTLWLVIAAWLDNSIQEAWQGPRQKRFPDQQHVVVAADGTPMICATSWKDYPRATTTYHDLSGAVHQVPDRKNLRPAVYLPGEVGSWGAFSSYPDWRLRIKVFVNEREPTANWFFVHDGHPDGTGYFVGYEQTTNRRLGFIGLSGFRSDPVPGNARIPVRWEMLRDQSQWSSRPDSLEWGNRRSYQPDRWDIPPRLVYVPSGNDLRLVDLDCANHRDDLRSTRADRGDRCSETHLLGDWQAHDGAICPRAHQIEGLYTGPESQSHPDIDHSARDRPPKRCVVRAWGRPGYRRLWRSGRAGPVDKSDRTTHDLPDRTRRRNPE